MTDLNLLLAERRNATRHAALLLTLMSFLWGGIAMAAPAAPAPGSLAGLELAFAAAPEGESLPLAQALPAPAPRAPAPRAARLSRAKSADTSTTPAILSTGNLTGDPYTQGATFTLDIILRNNVQAPIRSYMIRIYYNGDYVTLDRATDLGLGGSFPPSLSPAKGSGENTYRNVSPFAGNVNNTQLNLSLVRLHFTVKTAPAKPHGVRLDENPPNPVIVDKENTPLYSIFDSSSSFLFDPATRARIGSLLLGLEPPPANLAGVDANGDGPVDAADFVFLLP